MSGFQGIGLGGGASTGGGAAAAGGALGPIGAIAGSLIGPIMGMIGQNKRRKQAMADQQQIMQWQLANQMQLNQQGSDLQFDLWNKTNYGAQMKHLKEAGLNAGLLYGKGGPGGVTGSQGGGSAQGGQAPTQFDIANKLNLSKMIEELKILAEQRKGVELDNESKDMDNTVKRRHGMNADLMEAENRYWQAVTKGQFMFDSNNDKDQKNYAKNNYSKMLENELVLQNVETRIRKETEKDEKMQAAYNTASLYLENELKKANYDLTRQQERKIWHDIWQGWVNAGFKGLDIIVKGRLKDIGLGGTKKPNKDIKQSLPYKGVNPNW